MAGSDLFVPGRYQSFMCVFQGQGQELTAPTTVWVAVGGRLAFADARSEEACAAAEPVAEARAA